VSLATSSEREPLETSPSQAPPEAPSSWPWRSLAIVAAVVIVGLWYWHSRRAADEAAKADAARAAARSVPVAAVPVREGDMAVALRGLGTVTAFNTVTVRSRVDGQLVDVHFQEGQFVKAGDPLAKIDPRPFEAQLTQAEGQLARDGAQLKDAEINLARFKDLLAKQFISKQQYDDQAAMVGQFGGAVKIDEGAIANAKLQIAYSNITAPIGGRVGLRLVDVGNIVHATDTNGIVVITQVEPIAVLFTVPEDQLSAVMKKLFAGGKLAVEAYDRAGTTKIATGELLTADNQIDATTGTFKLKAVFPNADHALFPNQFVNVRLLLDVRPNTTIVPAAAIRQGPQGAFVYVVRADQTAEVRPVTQGVAEGDDAAVEKGLQSGELVVVDGADKLKEGAKVDLGKPSAPPAAKRPGK
jgi:membrane fusion protein, multidrug efflux system